MSAVLRWMGLLALAALGAVRFWACVAGVALIVGADSAVLMGLLLLALPQRWLLQLAALGGALAVWHLPVVAALLLATPRAFLALPGVISTWLANRRHPRVRWSS